MITDDQIQNVAARISARSKEIAPPNGKAIALRMAEEILTNDPGFNASSAADAQIAAELRQLGVTVAVFQKACSEYRTSLKKSKASRKPRPVRKLASAKKPASRSEKRKGFSPSNPGLFGSHINDEDL